MTGDLHTWSSHYSHLQRPVYVKFRLYRINLRRSVCCTRQTLFYPFNLIKWKPLIILHFLFCFTYFTIFRVIFV